MMRRVLVVILLFNALIIIYEYKYCGRLKIKSNPDGLLLYESCSVLDVILGM